MKYLIIISALCLIRGVRTDHSETLWNFLFTNNSYNKHLRPVVNTSTELQIDLRLDVVAIVDFNEVEETLTLTAFLPLTWTDEYLRWDPGLYGNLTRLSIPQEIIWKPYINLQNSVVKLGELGTPSLQAVVHHTGLVVWEPMEVFTILCSVDVYKFPFDAQTCHLIFEPSGYGISEVVMEASVPVIGFHEYEGNSGWTVKSSRIVAKTERMDSYAICTLTLQRKHFYFLMNIFLPIMLLSILNIFAFLLPASSGEKASFVVTVFLSLAVFLTIVSGNLPENSEKISLLNVYVFGNTIISTLVTIVTIILIRLHNRGPSYPVPHCLKKLTMVLSGARNLRIDTLDMKGQDEVKDVRDVFDKETINNNSVEINTENNGGDGITWPDAVRALDKLFFGIFLVCNFIITVSLVGSAANK